MEEVFLTGYFQHLTYLLQHEDDPTILEQGTDLRARLESIKNSLENTHVDMGAPCTAGHAGDCWLLSNLVPWNKILHPIASELVEDIPGCLRLCSQRWACNRECDSDNIFEACITVHWLLKEHGCITRVDLNNRDLMLEHAWLFCQSLLESKAVKQLVLSSRHFNSDYHNVLADAPMYMEELNTLEYRNLPLNSYDLSYFSAGISGTLTELVFHEDSSKPQSGEAFLRGVGHCSKLKNIELRIGVLGSRGATALAKLLFRNDAAEKIEIQATRFTSGALQTFAESLHANPLLKLRHLGFVGCRLCGPGMALLANVLKHCTALTSLDFVKCECDIEVLVHGIVECSRLNKLCLEYSGVDDSAATALARWLRSCSDLGTLCLCGSWLTRQSVIGLLEGLSVNKSGTLLFLDDDKTSNDCDILGIAHRMNITERVGVSFTDRSFPQLAHAIRTNKYRCWHMMIEKDFCAASEQLVEIFAALCHNCHVEKLEVQTGELSDMSAEALAHLLAVSRTLKSVKLHIDVAPSHLKHILTSLTVNRCLSKLSVKKCSFDQSATNAFARVLKANKSLESFKLFKGDAESIEVVVVALKHNHTLLKLDVDGETVDSNAAYQFAEMRRRNHSTLNAAVRYAMRNSTDKRLAVSFERVYRCDSLLSHLTKVASVSEIEAAGIVRSTVRYIRSKYLVITGIVRRTLQCTDCASVQIDHLSQECLEQIFSFLQLSDVL